MKDFPSHWWFDFCLERASRDSPAAVDAAGVGVRLGADAVANRSPGIHGDEGSPDGLTPTVGQLSRHNARVAAVRNCGELARCAS